MTLNNTDIERTSKDTNRSVSYMPVWLIAIAIILGVLRASDMFMTASRAVAGKDNADVVVWNELPTNAQLRAEAGTGNVVKQAPISELSPASQKQLRELLADSAAQKKHLLLEFSAAWSDPCKKMESTSLKNEQVQKLINGQFVALKIRDTQREIGKNSKFVSDLQKRYHIFAFPTLLVVGDDEQPIATLIGNCSSLTTYRFLSRAMNTRIANN